MRKSSLAGRISRYLGAAPFPVGISLSRYLVISLSRYFEGRRFRSRSRHPVISIFRYLDISRSRHLEISLSRFLALFLVIAGLTSCEYKELCYDHDHGSEKNVSLELDLKLDLEVSLDVSEETHTLIEVPDYMKVCFYDPESGALNNTEFVGGYGGELHVEPGTYDLLTYSFGTEWTQIRGESNVSTLEAFTSDITQAKASQLAAFTRSGEYEAPGPIIYTPDHLLVAHRVVEIPPYSVGHHVITITATAATIVETYSFEVTNVTGLEYISSVEAFVTNQARSSFFGRGEKSTEPATIYFPIEVNRKEGTLKTTFNTFGKLPGESHSYLHILLTDTDGNPHTITEDITDQFDDPDHTIVVDVPIVIPQPEGGGGGGIAPTVDPWQEESHDVPIG